MATTLTPGIYQIVSTSTRNAWDYAGQPSNLNAVTCNTACYPGSGAPRAQQNWTFDKHGDFWKIVNAQHPNHVTMNDGDSEDNTVVEITPEFETDRQLWTVEVHRSPNCVTYFTFRNKASNTLATIRSPTSGSPIVGMESVVDPGEQAFMLLPVNH